MMGLERCSAQRLIFREKLDGPSQKCKDEEVPGAGGRWSSRTLLAVPKKKIAYCGYVWQPDPPAMKSGGGDAGIDYKAGAPKTLYVRAPYFPPPTSQDLAVPDLEVARNKLVGRGISANEIEVDCQVMRSSSPPTPIPDADWKPLQANFRKQAGQPAVWPTAPRKAVHVAVIDSAVLGYERLDDTERYPHGRTVGRVIGDLACPDPYNTGCEVSISNFLALPQVGPIEMDLDHGGFFGTRGQLSEQITKALDAFDLNTDRLVINLSLGWDTSLDQAYPGPIGQDSVHDALTRAACMGALTIAGAGNLSVYQNSPTLPGGWEIQNAPTKSECENDYGFHWRTFAEQGKYRPLVYAAAAVDAKDVPLITTRPDGQPRLVAYGRNVITDDRRATKHTALMTGASMATAVASGAAAAAWAYAPDKDAHAIMDVIYGSAVDVTPALAAVAPAPIPTTDFCNGGPPCNFPLRRVSVCNALMAVVAGYKCDLVLAGAGTNVNYSPPPGESAPGNPPVTAPPCLTGSCSEIGGPEPAEPWVMPQPSWPICVPCQLSSIWWHPLRVWIDRASAPSWGSVTWVAVWTNTQGYLPSIQVSADQTTTYLSVSTGTAAVPAPTSASVSFYRKYYNGSVYKEGWSDWQDVTPTSN